MKSVKRRTTITELVVVWSFCSVCTYTLGTSVTKSKPGILYNASSFLLQLLQGVGKFQYQEFNIQEEERLY